ncbi:hypothetical protein ABTA52_19510, partial [Acinetobacter baumannii]
IVGLAIGIETIRIEEPAIRKCTAIEHKISNIVITTCEIECRTLIVGIGGKKQYLIDPVLNQI